MQDCEGEGGCPGCGCVGGGGGEEGGGGGGRREGEGEAVTEDGGGAGEEEEAAEFVGELGVGFWGAWGYGVAEGERSVSGGEEGGLFIELEPMIVRAVGRREGCFEFTVCVIVSCVPDGGGGADEAAQES